MARPKPAFIKGLAVQAQSDLSILDRQGVAVKLKAIIAVAKHPVERVADVMGVAAQTIDLFRNSPNRKFLFADVWDFEVAHHGYERSLIWRWVTAYRKEGLDGLYPKPKKPKPSKLNTEQKAIVISWLDSSKTAKGENIHWTLSQLRNAITEEFGVTLGINTIWVWLRKESWKLKVPRPKHYSADKQAQHTFKKNS